MSYKGLGRIFKDAAGVLTELSAICRHLGGVVRWHPSEKSWDCPCHGSRFDCTGKLIEGPAKKVLKVIRSDNALNSHEYVLGNSIMNP